MAKQRLTDKLVSSLKPATEKRYELWDTILIGFGVRVTDKGRKTWFVMYSMFGRRRRMTLGTYPAKSLAEARELARDALADVEKGIDPAAEKIQKRTSRPQTFGELAEEYLKRHARPNKRTAKDDENKLNADVLPKWRHMPVEQIRRGDVLQILEAVHNRGAPYAANRLLALIRKIFNWGMEKDLVDFSPIAGVKALGNERSRDRALSDKELKEVWGAAQKLNWPWNGFFQLAILTGQRRGEVAGMRWDELDLEAGVWSLKADRTKNDRAHDVPLTQAVLDVLNALPKYSGVFVFPARAKPDAATHVSGFSKAKKEIDRVCDVADWRIHDLRRTAATGMAGLGIAQHVVEKALNHVSGQISGVAAVYNRYGYEDEKRHALEAWTQHVLSLGKAKPRNVVQFTK